MARKTIRVDVPRGNPADLVKLTLGIVKQHKKLAANSPITNAVVNMAAFEARANQADVLEQDIESLERELQEKVGKRDQLLGIADGQNAQTEGSLLFETLKIRDLLLAVNRGNEQALEPWTFNVVVGSAAARKSKVAPAK